MIVDTAQISRIFVSFLLPDRGGRAGRKIERFHEHEPNQAGVVAMQVSSAVCALLELPRVMVEMMSRMEMFIELFLRPGNKGDRESIYFEIL
jgi:hypothetical protein